jgi:hypothetical protein
MVPYTRRGDLGLREAPPGTGVMMGGLRLSDYCRIIVTEEYKHGMQMRVGLGLGGSQTLQIKVLALNICG